MLGVNPRIDEAPHRGRRRRSTEDMFTVTAALPDPVDAVRPAGDRGGQIGEHRTWRIGPRAPIRVRHAAVTCAESPVSPATSRRIPTPACDTTPWPSADTFTRATAALLFTCEVPSDRRCGILNKSHYALQDRHFRALTHTTNDICARNPG